MHCMVNCFFSYPDKLLSIENTLHMSVDDGQFSLHHISDDYICVCPSLPFLTLHHFILSKRLKDVLIALKTWSQFKINENVSLMF